MDLRQLTNFLHVAEMQSLSKAAVFLRLAQPALSRQVKALEEELGVPLLVRHGWGVTPTPAGAILMDHVRRVQREVHSARDAVLAYQSEPAGRLSLGVPTSLGLVMLPELARRVRERYPKLRLHLVEGFSGSIHEWLLSGRLDLAVLYETKAMGGLAVSPLLAEEMVAVAEAGRFPAGGTVALSQLDELILPGRPHRLRLTVDEAFASAGLDCEPVLEVDALPTIIELVRRGEGCTLLPYSAVHQQVAAGSLSCAGLTPAVGRTLVLARPQDRIPSPAIAALEAEVKEFVARQASMLNWKSSE